MKRSSLALALTFLGMGSWSALFADPCRFNTPPRLHPMPMLKLTRFNHLERSLDLRRYARDRETGFDHLYFSVTSLSHAIGVAFDCGTVYVWATEKVRGLHAVRITVQDPQGLTHSRILRVRIGA